MFVVAPHRMHGFHAHIPTTRARAAGAAVRDVTCEQCGCRYCYRLVRRGEGKALGDNAEAERTARGRATGAMQRLLKTDDDPVPCPDCGWFQRSMVRGHHRQRAIRFRWLRIAAWVLLLVSGFGLLMTAFEASVQCQKLFALRVDRPLQSPSLVGAAAGAVALLIYLLLRRGRNLNADFPNVRHSLPGMPRSFKAGEEGPGGDHPAAMTDAYDAFRSGGWLTVQLLDVRFPPLCAACLQPTHAAERIEPLSTGASILLPHCAACQRSARRKRRKAEFAGAAAAAVVVNALFSLAGFPIREWALIGSCSAAALVAGFFAAGFLARQYLRPVRFRRFASARNVIDVRFRNPDYAALFAEANRHDPGR